MFEPDVPEGSLVDTLHHVPAGMYSLDQSGQGCPRAQVVAAFKSSIEYLSVDPVPSQAGEEPDSVDLYCHINSSIDSQPALRIVGVVVGRDQVVKSIVNFVDGRVNITEEGELLGVNEGC